MLFFLDESGTDQKEAPYEILCGLGVRNENVWRLIQAISGLEQQYFGVNLHSLNIEIKGSKLLSSRRFKFAQQCGLMSRELRRNLVREFLLRSSEAKRLKREVSPSSEQLAALGQSSLAFVNGVLDTCQRYEAKAFAAIVQKGAPKPSGEPGMLRKDYRYLLERFARLVKSVSREEKGILVFDEIERKETRRLINQFDRYCNETMSGYRVSDCIIPSPFFINSESNPLVQIADIIAYCLNWGWRHHHRMGEKTRPEFAPLIKKIVHLQWKGYDPDELIPRRWNHFGFFYLTDLTDSQHGQKKGEETKFPPQGEAQRNTVKVSMPLKQQLLLFDSPSTPIPKIPNNVFEFFDE